MERFEIYMAATGEHLVTIETDFVALDLALRSFAAEIQSALVSVSDAYVAKWGVRGGMSIMPHGESKRWRDKASVSAMSIVVRQEILGEIAAQMDAMNERMRKAK